MHVGIVADFDELERRSAAWNALSGDVPFRRWEWVSAWWKNFARSSWQPAVLWISDDAGEPVGIVPWYLDRSAIRGRVLRFLTCDDRSGLCTDYMSLLAAPGHASEVARTAAEFLMDGSTGSIVPESSQANGNDEAGESSYRDGSAESYGQANSLRWDLVELLGIDPEDEGVDRFVSELGSRGATIQRTFGESCWRIPLPATWDEYRSMLSKGHRRHVRKAEEYIDRGEASLRTVQSAEELDAALKLLIDLSEKRTTSVGKRGCFCCEKFRSFFRDMSHAFLKAGRLEMHLLELHGQVAAVQYHLLGGDVAYAYQSGINPATLEHEPGHIAYVATLRRAIALKRSGFDFLRGDERYKASWRAAPRRTAQVSIVSPNPSARVRNSLWNTRNAARELVRRGYKWSTAWMW